MLKGIDPLLTPELLKVLAEMGHGDEIVLADANFTAVALAAGKPLVRLPGADMRRAAAAVLSLLPLDEMVERPVAYMQVGGTEPPYRSALQREVIDELASRGHLRPLQCEPTERFAFYARVSGAFAVVQTGEMQAWANFILKKGVIAEALRP
ncbi:RbsD/FucU domain-containing protein [uncultured Piscinibacter sp.]|uniref:RbsD/FucU family protein n=1 Tax=uncultured Piscinibacter sp. TaxID=1131835 RepID=UPI00262A3DC1|nr:RbsD/FucU domain-containing protein [uncultured Piscinibacter sp.]